MVVSRGALLTESVQRNSMVYKNLVCNIVSQRDVLVTR